MSVKSFCCHHRKFLSHWHEYRSMTVLSFDEHGVDVVYEGTEFRLEKSLIEEAIEKEYPEVTDHEVLQIVDAHSALSGEPQQIADILA